MSNNLEDLKRLTGESHIEGLLKHHYNLELTEIVHDGTNIKVVSDMGEFLIRQVTSEQIEKYKILSQLYQHIGENKEAFFPVVSPRITTSAQPYFHGYSNSYVLLPWVEGSEVRLETDEDWGKVARTLAKFHKSTKDFQPFTPFPGNVQPPTWGKRWREAARQLEVFTLAPKLANNPTEFDMLWLDNAKFINSMFEDVVNYYKRINGDRIYADSLKHSRVCYGNIRQHNMLLSPEGRLRLLGWSKISIDSRAQDLKDLLVYAYGKTSSKGTISHILYNYNKVYMLDPSEHNLAYASLVFPERIMALLDAVYTKQSLTAEEAAKRIIKVSKYENKKLGLIRDYADILKDEFDISVLSIDWIHR